MRYAKTLAICVGVVFALTFTASSVRADAICADSQIVKFNNLESFVLNLPDQSRAAAAHLFAEHFENNNGKHLGFTVAAIHRGNKFGLFKEHKPRGNDSFRGNDTIPNPEPAAVFLLGTGLAAAGGFARRRFRKPKA